MYLQTLFDHEGTGIMNPTFAKSKLVAQWKSSTP